MGLALVTMFADKAGEVKVRDGHGDTQLLVRLPTGAGVRGFAFVHVQLAAARTPKSAIRLLRAFEQQHLIALAEAIKQRGNFVRQRHDSDMVSGTRSKSRTFQKSRPASTRPGFL